MAQRTRLDGYRELRLVLLILAVVVIWAAELRANTKSEGHDQHGKVIAIRVEEQAEHTPVMPPDSKGRTQGDTVFVHRKLIYRVETDAQIYEFEGGKKQDLDLGEMLEFRVGEKIVKIRANRLKRKYKLISTSPKE
jgi:hypothetical protein